MISCGEQRRPPTKSKDPQPPTALDAASGTASRTRPATPGSTRRATSLAITTGDTATTSRSCRSWVSTLTASAWRGAGFIRAERERSTKRESTFIRNSSTACSRRESSPISRSTTGICPKRSTIGAAGSIETSRSGSETTQSRFSMHLAIAWRCGRLSMNPGSSPTEVISPASSHPATRICSRRQSPPTISSAPTAQRSRGSAPPTRPRGGRSDWSSTSSPSIRRLSPRRI